MTQELDSLGTQEKQVLLAKLQSHLIDDRIELIDKVCSERTEHICLVLENLYQEHNASAILRNADAFGIQNINVIENDNDFAANKEVSMSAHKWLDIKAWNESKIDNTVKCLSALKKQGYKICATSLRPESITLDELPVDEPIALCFGTELTGLSEVAHEMADYMTYIPMNGFIQSFNVSVASALSLSHLRNKMKRKNIEHALSPEKTLDTKINWSLSSMKRPETMLEYYLKQL
ncbi:spoU protein [Lentisphaera araneosa HTCC2155]|jgi:tRNA (guanosine-2'-O-)-methyltransferase|uniref:tRNA (guanosine(18)-2'-O)-methyltransferase n=1 Tax=Lentisphaera araneosa HTCC2155 TaxID=313628 RepID=A6DFW8_9BACT|nr:RNA methyltransferase [Lentisphaera araneosa]EDM29698.1 spoU protein [Lentisphaera araneosa HTCC2155]